MPVPSRVRIMVVVALALLHALTALAPPPGLSGTLGAEAPVLDLVGQTGGLVGPLAVEGDRLYAAVGTSLAVLDVADPATPRLVGRSQPMAAPITDLAVTADRAYVATGDGLVALDLAAPGGPAVLGTYRAAGEIRILAADHRFVYTIASASSKAGTFQVLAPGPDGQLAMIGALPLAAGVTGTEAAQMVVRDGTVFVATNSLGVVAIDVSAPAVPSPRGAYEDIAASGIAVGTDRIFAIGSRRRLDGSGQPATTAYLFALSTRPGTYLSPDATLLLGQPDDPDFASYVGAWDRFVYVGVRAGSTIRILDGRQADALPEIDQLRLPGGFDAAYQGPKTGVVDRGRVFVAVNGSCGLGCDGWGSLNGVLAVDGPPPARVTGAWLEDRPADPSSLASGDGALAVGGGTQAIHFVETRSPTMPRFRGVITLPDPVVDLAAQGHRLLASTNIHASLVDFADPAAPALVQGPDVAGFRMLRSVAIDGDIACAVAQPSEADHEARLVVWSQEPGGRLRRRGELTLGPWPDFTYHMTVRAGLAYLASMATGLTIVDLRAPDKPARLGQVAIATSAQAVAVSGRYAFVTTRFPRPAEEQAKPNPRTLAGLTVVDVSDPARPRVVGTYATLLDGFAARGQRWGVAVLGHYALIALHDRWLRAVDVSDPTAPRLAQALPVPGGAFDVAASGELAYVAAHEGGLLVYRRHVAGDGGRRLWLPFALIRRPSGGG